MTRPALLAELAQTSRFLFRAPVFSIAAILCIGLGIGGTAAVWSAVERALLNPLPFQSPGRLVTVYRTTPRSSTSPLSAPNYLDLSRETRQIESLAAIATGGGLLLLPDGSVLVSATRVTGNLFPMLGVNALRGRLLTPEDDSPDAPLATVMSEQLWRERFGGDPGIVGRIVVLSGQVYTVVGVAPQEFRIAQGTRVFRSELWVPMRFAAAELGQRRRSFLSVVGRLAPGASPQSAAAELVSIFDNVVQTNSELRGEQIRVLTMQADATGTIGSQLALVLGAVAIVFLIAVTNVASLFLARQVQRRPETAIRAALGATRAQVMRPGLMESAVLSLAGLALGLALAMAGVSAVSEFAALRLPHIAGLSVDFRVVAFAASLTLLVIVLCGVLPAWRSAVIDPHDALRSGRGGATARASHRTLKALVVSEIALSLILVLSAGLAFKGFAQLISKEPGFDPAPILTLTAVVSADWYPDGNTIARFLEPMLERIRQRPGIEAAGMISAIPYDDWGSNIFVRYEGQPVNETTRLPVVETRVVTPEFFNVSRQRLITGRLLERSDGERPDMPAAVVVNQSLVDRDFSGVDPIGKRLYTDGASATIVGVVTDIRNFGPQEEPRPEVYWTARQRARGASSFPLMIRVRAGDPNAAIADVRAAIASVEPRVAVTRVRTMQEVIAASVDRPRFYLTLLGVFAAVAMALAACGIYGVVSYAAAQRTREFGIRTALGSAPRQTLALVAREGASLVALGVGVGLAGAAAVTRFIAGMLYGVDPFDAAAWAVATGALVTTTLVAMLLPAVRATRADPLLAIRGE